MRAAGLTHFGESADVYAGRLGGVQRVFALAYLQYLRHGGHPPPPMLLTHAEVDRITHRLRNTGTSQDFARRAIGGTMGTFRRRAAPVHRHVHRGR